MPDQPFDDPIDHTRLVDVVVEWSGNGTGGLVYDINLAVDGKFAHLAIGEWCLHGWSISQVQQ